MITNFNNQPLIRPYYLFVNKGEEGLQFSLVFFVKIVVDINNPYQIFEGKQFLSTEIAYTTHFEIHVVEIFTVEIFTFSDNWGICGA